MMNTDLMLDNETCGDIAIIAFERQGLTMQANDKGDGSLIPFSAPAVVEAMARHGITLDDLNQVGRQTGTTCSDGIDFGFEDNADTLTCWHDWQLSNMPRTPRRIDEVEVRDALAYVIADVQTLVQAAEQEARAIEDYMQRSVDFHPVSTHWFEQGIRYSVNIDPVMPMLHAIILDEVSTADDISYSAILQAFHTETGKVLECQSSSLLSRGDMEAFRSEVADWLPCGSNAPHFRSAISEHLDRNIGAAVKELTNDVDREFRTDEPPRIIRSWR